MKHITLKFLVCCMILSSTTTLKPHETIHQTLQYLYKQFEESSWWYKGPALIVGYYTFSRSCDYLFSCLFKRKPKQKIDSNEFQHMKGDIAAIKALNKDNVNIGALNLTLDDFIVKFKNYKKLDAWKTTDMVNTINQRTLSIEEKINLLVNRREHRKKIDIRSKRHSPEGSSGEQYRGKSGIGTPRDPWSSDDSPPEQVDESTFIQKKEEKEEKIKGEE